MACAGWDLFQCDFPMPFARHGVGQIVNHGDQPVTLRAAVAASGSRADGDMYFHARCHATVTQPGVPHVICAVDGKGTYVGTAVTLVGDTDLKFLEGNDQILADGQKLEGTGTEDFFNGGWFFRFGPYADRFAGASVLAAGKSRVAAYRWQVADCVPFDKHLDVCLQHGPENDTPGLSYRSVGYWYAAEPKAVESSGPAVALPVYSEKGDGAVILEAESVADSVTADGVTCQAVDDSEGGLPASGGKALQAVFGRAEGGSLGLPLTVQQDGLFDLSLRLIGSSLLGVPEVTVDDKPIVAPESGIDLGESLAKLGRARLTAGQHVLTLAVKPVSGTAVGGRLLIDYVQLREVGKIKDALEAESLGATARGGQVSLLTDLVGQIVRAPDVIGGSVPTEPVCSGGAALLFTPRHDHDQCVLPFEVADNGDYGVAISLLRGPDYGSCLISLDGERVTKDPVSCDDAVLTVGGRLGLGTHRLRKGRHQLVVYAVSAKLKEPVKPLAIDYLLAKASLKGHEAEFLAPISELARKSVVKERFGAEPRWSGGAYLRVPGGKIGDSASFWLFAPRAGTYTVKVVEARAPSTGKFAVTLAGRKLGQIDGHADGEALGKGLEVTVKLKRGANPLTLTTLDGNDMALDVIEVVWRHGPFPWQIVLFILLLLLLLARTRQSRSHLGELRARLTQP
jgi:hypothetical protein